MLKKRLGIEAIERVWYSNEKLINYFKIPSTLIIPEGCVEIGECAFWGCGLKEAIIPESVEEIGDCAFASSPLMKVIIPEGCKGVGAKAFEFCNRLEEVVISESVKEIGNYAFYRCSNATIILRKPKSEIEFIGVYAFACCRDVKEETRP